MKNIYEMCVYKHMFSFSVCYGDCAAISGVLVAKIRMCQCADSNGTERDSCSLWYYVVANASPSQTWA